MREGRDPHPLVSGPGPFVSRPLPQGERRKAPLAVALLLLAGAAPGLAEEGTGGAAALPKGDDGAAPTLALSAASVSQGGLFRATLRHPGGIREASGRLGDVPVAPTKDSFGAWSALVGVDLEDKPGPVALEMEGRLASGRSFRVRETVEVLPGDFPVQKLTVDDKFQKLSKAVLARVERENKRLGAIWNSASPTRLWDGPFALPIAGEWGSGFGARREFNGVPKRPHSGADVKAAEGAPFDAPAAGRVALAEDLYFSGNTVILDHGGGLYTMFFHLSRFAVKEGDRVEKGARIGYVGKTGRVTGPHLHWGARLNRARVDPDALVRLTQSDLDGAAPVPEASP